MEAISKLIGGILLVIILAVILAAIIAYPAMLLWNWLMPELFGLKFITFWQMFGLIALVRIILPSPSSSKSE